MLAIDEAMVRVQQIQADLSISEVYELNDAGSIVATPLAVSIARAYPYFPSQSHPPSQFPCFINQWTAPTMQFNSVMLSGEFSIHMNLLVKDANSDRSAAIASAFYPKVVQAFAENIKLGGWAPATVLQLRGGDPTLAALTYAGQTFIGLDLFLDIYLNKAKIMEP